MTDTTDQSSLDTGASPEESAVPLPERTRIEDGRVIYEFLEQEKRRIPLDYLLRDGIPDLYPEVAKKDHFQLELRRDGLLIQARGYVGIIPLNDRVAIDVRPRVPIANLERLFRISEQSAQQLNLSTYLSRHPEHLESNPSLLDLLTRGLLLAIDEIRQQGLHHDYVQRITNTSFPHGRIMVGETLQRHLGRGISHRAVTTWFERAIDTGPNRCLKFVLAYLAHHYRSLPQDRKTKQYLTDLNHAFLLFDSVSTDTTQTFMAEPLVREPIMMPITRSAYVPALSLALTILRNRSVAFTTHGTLHMPAFVIALYEIFEAYIRKVLHNALRDQTWWLDVLNGNLSPEAGGGRKRLFQEGYPTDLAVQDATPDIVLKSHGPTTAAPYPVIIDTKYTAITRVADRDAIEQAITYGASYRAPHVVLVFPYVDRPALLSGLQTVGHLGNVVVHQYVFNLDAPITDTEERAFASAILALACG